jgi:hypothetical protein
MSTQTKIEVEDHRNTIESKQEAFALALANFNLQQERNKA